MDIYFFNSLYTLAVGGIVLIILRINNNPELRDKRINSTLYKKYGRRGVFCLLEIMLIDKTINGVIRETRTND